VANDDEVLKLVACERAWRGQRLDALDIVVLLDAAIAVVVELRCSLNWWEVGKQ
jgi:hypothetical protein